MRFVYDQYAWGGMTPALYLQPPASRRRGQEAEGWCGVVFVAFHPLIRWLSMPIAEV
jgi:hypothetical protein